MNSVRNFKGKLNTILLFKPFIQEQKKSDFFDYLQRLEKKDVSDGDVRQRSIELDAKLGTFQTDDNVSDDEKTLISIILNKEFDFEKILTFIKQDAADGVNPVSNKIACENLRQSFSHLLVKYIQANRGGIVDKLVLGKDDMTKRCELLMTHFSLAFPNSFKRTDVPKEFLVPSYNNTLIKVRIQNSTTIPSFVILFVDGCVLFAEETQARGVFKMTDQFTMEIKNLEGTTQKVQELTCQTHAGTSQRFIGQSIGNKVLSFYDVDENPVQPSTLEEFTLINDRMKKIPT